MASPPSEQIASQLDPLLLTLPDPVLCVAADRRIRYANDAAQAAWREASGLANTAVTRMEVRAYLATLLRTDEAALDELDEALRALLAAQAHVRTVRLHAGSERDPLGRSVHASVVRGSDPPLVALLLRGFAPASARSDPPQAERTQPPHAPPGVDPELIASRQFLDATLNALAAHVAILDEDGVIVAVNEAWRQFADANESTDASHYIGTNYVNICSGSFGPSSEGAGDVAKGLGALLEGKLQTFQYEYPCHAPREQRWFLMRASRFELGRKRWVVVAHLNVTERKRSELELLELHERHTQILRVLQEGLIALDQRGRITVANEEAQALLARRGESLVGKLADMVLRTPSGHFALPRPSNYPAPDEQTSGEFECRRGDGSVGRFAFTCRALAPRGAATEVVVSFRAAEQAATTPVATPSRLGSQMINSPLAVIEWDEQGRVRAWSSKAQELLGWHASEVRGLTLNEWPLFGEEAQAEAQSRLHALLSGRVQHDTVKLATQTRNDGTLQCAWYNTAVLDKRERPTAIISLVQDLTEAVEVQAKLRETVAQLERSNAELEQFAYVTSHDLQEPLRMVASFCTLLRQRYKGKISDDADEFITYALDGVGRMRHLITDLLAYSRLSRTEPALSEFSAATACRDAEENIRALVAERGAEVHIGELPQIRADRMRITQVFQNLIQNGIKFNKATIPTVAIEARAVEESAAWWEFSVRDNGIGIPPQQRERVFAIFQRLHTSAEYTGTGIGLAICEKIISSHGGRIWIEAPAEGGTVFRFTVPGVAR